MWGVLLFYSYKTEIEMPQIVTVFPCVRNKELGVQELEHEIHLFHFLAQLFWMNLRDSLSLSFLICRMRKQQKIFYRISWHITVTH